LYIPTRRRARFYALGAAFLSGGYLFALVTTVVSESRVTGPTALQKAPISLLGIAIGLALLWWSLWWLDIVNPRRIQEEFRAEGRQVTTRTAALFAYLSIVGTGVLVLSAIVFARVHWQAVAGGITVWFGLVTVAFSLPLLYFAAGSVYQLRNVLGLMRRFNRYAETVDPDQLPVTAAYPVMRIPTEALYPQATVERSQETQTGDEDEREGMLFAAAYADPFTRAIILTEYTFNTLSDEELAAVIAHEESHFRYRGAQLQFLFATVPAFVLLGKNVVYSIYDFFQRELTADQHAYVALSTRNQMTPVESLRDVLKRFSREALTFDESGLSFLPTMLSVPERKRVGRRLEQWFDLFYGNFAGDVHPDMETRLHAINHSETIPLEMASDPEERVGLILEELESEDQDRTPD
jgi:Zn-dependent protease with chaperone function